MSFSPSRRATLSDVARLAGVSLGSASKALSDPETVRPKTRTAVEAAAEQLGYVPNGTARALAMRRSMMVGVVLPTISNPVFAGFVHALQKQLIGAGYHLLVQAHEYDRATERTFIERLIQRGIDGLVLIGGDQHPDVAAMLARARLPHIVGWASDGATATGGVGFSNEKAMQAIIHHLLDLGHRRFALLSGQLVHNERARARLEGARSALAAAGLPLEDDHMFFQPFSIEGGRAGLRTALSLSPRPTALVCTTDLMAAGALAEAHAHDIGVPEDISITGFDDIDVASLMAPPLTTIRAPIADMGRLAGVQIIAAMQDSPIAPAIMLDAPLVVRGSTGPA